MHKGGTRAPREMGDLIGAARERTARQQGRECGRGAWLGPPGAGAALPWARAVSWYVLLIPITLAFHSVTNTAHRIG